MNKQIELFKQGTPNVRVYDNGYTFDCYTIVWPYKAGFSALNQDGAICTHFEETGFRSNYPNPLDSEGYKHLGKKTKWEDLPESVKQSILYLFPLIWDIHPGNV